MKNFFLIGCLLLISCFLISHRGAWAEKKLVIADFEKGRLNSLGGDAGFYGSLEPGGVASKDVPYSGIYDLSTPGYIEANVHSGEGSLRLVNALGANPAENWGSFGMELGPTIDFIAKPKKIESRDVSGYKYLIFWVKGEKGGEHLEAIFRDARASSYMPQLKYKVSDATTKWQRIIVPLDEIKEKINLMALDTVGITFGDNVGNKKGAIIYLDDFSFADFIERVEIQ